MIDGYKWAELGQVRDACITSLTSDVRLQSTLSEGKKFAALAIREPLIRFDGPGVELWCYSKLPVETVIKHFQALFTAILL